jgi:hypothetical protein
VVEIKEELVCIGRQLVEMFGGPLRCFTIQWTLDVVTLKSKHLANAHDHATQRFGGTPVISNADCVRRDVGMKHRRQHPARRRIARITAWQSDFQSMPIDKEQFLAALL